MACPANSRETKIGVGFIAQADLQTPNTAAEIWSFTTTNTAPFTITPTTETDAGDIGKGDEFPMTMYPVSMDVTGRIEKQISSEAAAWAFAFGLGNTTRVPTAPGMKYDCAPTDPAVHCIDLPPFTAVEQIRPEAAPPFTDRAMPGCVVTGFSLTLESGPGRNNARLGVDIAGTGKIITPSAIIIPPLTPEHYLNAASATIVVNGQDYVLSKSFISAEITWAVNARLDTGYYPGSGVDQYGYALRGRMEYSNRVAGMTFVARAQPGSPEFLALMQRSEGTTEVTLTGAYLTGSTGPKHEIRVFFPRSVISAATNGDADGLVTISATVTPLKHATQGYCLFSATTTKNDIDPMTAYTAVLRAA